MAARSLTYCDVMSLSTEELSAALEHDAAERVKTDEPRALVAVRAAGAVEPGDDDDGVPADVGLHVLFRGLDDGGYVAWRVTVRAAKESEIPNFKGSFLGRFPLVSADFWTSDHLLERLRSVGAFPGTRARGTLKLKRR